MPRSYTTVIKIYPSLPTFCNPEEHDPIYSCPVEPGETVLEAVQRLVPSYDPATPGAWECRVNGGKVDASRYGSVVLGPDTQVHFFLVPRGDVISLVLNVFTLGAWSLVMKFLTPRVPGTKGTGGQRDRDDMDMASVKANTVKQGSVVREKFGQGRIYPDHLVQIRRYFLDEAPTRQACEMFLSLGRGKFLIDFAKSKIGETVQAALGANLVVNTYGPGADVSAEPMADNWFTSAEVGGTSSGTAGLDLTVTSDILLNSEGLTYVLSGTSVTIPAGAGSWPTGWTAGMILRALTPYNWTVVDGGVGARDQITGPWAQIAPVVGMKIEVAGAFNGQFVVAAVNTTGPTINYVTLNYPDGSPVTALPLGTFSLTVGFKGLQFRIATFAAQVITLQRLTDTGATDGTWPGFDSLTTSSARFTLQATNTEGGWSGPYSGCPEGELATHGEVDFFYPGGLYRANEDGNPEPYTVVVEVQYRDLDLAGAWTSLQYSHTTGIIAQVGYTHRFALPYPMRHEVRTRRITLDSPEGTIADQVQWYGLKGKLVRRANSYADMTTAAARVFGGGALAAQAEQMVSFWVTRILPYRSAGAWVEGPTRSIAAAALYVAKDRGYTDARLDLAEWDRLGTIWDSRGDYFDGSFEKETTAEAALNVICRAGYAQVISPRGVLRPVRDALRSPAEQAVARLYGPDNAKDIVRSGQPVSKNDTDGVDVKYMNPSTWTTETVRCRLPSIPNPTKIVELTVEGVNDRTRAYRLGMRELCGVRYRRWKNTFSTGMDSFASGYMDYAEVMDNIPELSVAAHLRDWDGTVFQSNEPVGDSTVVALRRPDGTKFGPVDLTKTGAYTFTISGALDFTPVREYDAGGRTPTLLFLGQTEQMFWPVLISSVQPSGQYRANVEAVGYDERVYQYDDAEPPVDA